MEGGQTIAEYLKAIRKLSEAGHSDSEGGFLVPDDVMNGYWERRAWPIRLWRRLRGHQVDDWVPGLLERIQSQSIRRRAEKGL